MKNTIIKLIIFIIINTYLFFIATKPQTPTEWEWTTIPGTFIVVPDENCYWWWRPYYTNKRIGVGTDG